MNDADPTDSLPPAVPFSYADFTYRCVCGASLQIDPVEGGRCPECRRHYDPSVLAGDGGGETVLATQFARQRPAAAVRGEDRDPLIGQQWEHFQIVERLGRGGMGAVYRALDESLQRYVALKVIREETVSEDDSAHVQQLFQEARAQARVNHPHVVHIYYVGKSHGAPFFAMELIGGPTLAQRLESGPLPFAEVVRVALQLCQALKHAARFDIVHGDIKPSNILQLDAQTVKLSDFGLARRLSELQAAGGPAAGTPNYLSPEAAAGTPTDFRSDMYCLGVTLFELTFGRLPYTFTSPSVHERLEAHRHRPVEFPEPWPDSVPEAWREILMRLLQKNPDDRYADYDELIEHLLHVRPLTLPPAGRLQRGLAWLVDVTLVLGAQAILSSPLALPAVQEFLDHRPLLRLLAAATTGLVPFFVAPFLCWLGNTPGKKLFQIRVVDPHGLTPPPSVLAPRSVFQFLPAWSVAATHLLRALRLDPMAPLLAVAALGTFLIEMGCTFFTTHRRSLHDLLFRTQVVLDAGETNRTGSLRD